MNVKCNVGRFKTRENAASYAHESVCCRHLPYGGLAIAERVSFGSALCLVPFIVLLIIARTSYGTPLYHIVTLGFEGAEYTQNNGQKYSDTGQRNQSGQVIGWSLRFDNAGNAGATAWIYDGTTTSIVGLTDAEHTRSDGYKFSEAEQLNEAGQIRGSSYDFSGGDSFPDGAAQSAWVYDGTNTINIGLLGAGYVRDDGFKYSQSYELNEAGQVSGYSRRFNGSIDLGRTVWLYNGTTTTEIGLTGAEYTANDGSKLSYGGYLNDSGQVAGTSVRYQGGGESAWLYNGTTTVNIGLAGALVSRAGSINGAGQVLGSSERKSGGGQIVWLYGGGTTFAIGLTDVEHTRDDGYSNNIAEQLNEAGYVRGSAERYNGGGSDMNLGRSEWIYNGSTTINIGLTGPEHTQSDGSKYSQSFGMNEAGQVRGYSKRYNGGISDLGISAWLYNGTTTVDIGLTGAEYTRNDGYKSSSTATLNDAGQVIGTSQRYSLTGKSLGLAAWLYDGTTTTEIGPTSAEYVRSDGFKRSEPKKLNEAGQVSGDSWRFNGSSLIGATAWLYDPSLDVTFPFVLSTRSDGYAESAVSYLGDDGLVLGRYKRYDAFDNFENRVFYFTVADGLHDLADLVEGGLTANGWDQLATASGFGVGQILGSGKRITQADGRMPYLLSTLPEPTSFALTTFALLGWIGSTRQRRKSQ